MIRSPNPTKWDDPLQYILSKTGYGSSHEMDVGNTEMDVSDSKKFVEYPEVGSSTLRDFIAKIWGPFGPWVKNLSVTFP